MTDSQQPYSKSRRQQRRQRRSKSSPLGGGKPRTDRSKRSRAVKLPQNSTQSDPATGMFGNMVDPSRHMRRTRRGSRSTWPPQPKSSFFPQLPKPLVYGIRLLIIGLGVAAIAGTVLSVLTPADEQLIRGTAAETQSAVTASADVDDTVLVRTQELTTLKAKLVELQDLIPELTPTIYVFDLDTGNYVDVAGNAAIPAASTIKLPILVAFFKAVDDGRITVDQAMAIQSGQIAEGSGDMQIQPPGTRYTALEVATQMIINSDNTATNMMIDLLGGAPALNQQFVDWGLGATVINNPLPDIEGTNTTSAQDLVRMFAHLHKGEIVSLRSRDRIFNILQRTYNKKLLPAGVSEATVSYNKTGNIGELLGDVALMDLPNGKRYAIATLVQRPDNDGRARELIRRISQTVYQTMNNAVPVLKPVAPSTETAPSSIPQSDSAPPSSQE
ncbi:serine hydrolase [Leptothoe spongobia]|uniref:Serine hydrolase n=1 Tax=Leptothoe spongobia TAU-MAC 1115 TaxID=1967444 RepID=A0A947DHZ4_9CYAN|nr:serine hydrolase [Leptothoe spongobia]MBT9316968.1 serine hydrolase [Leptothoe spongobia TAU-MAC 1115]